MKRYMSSVVANWLMVMVVFLALLLIITPVSVICYCYVKRSVLPQFHSICTAKRRYSFRLQCFVKDSSKSVSNGLVESPDTSLTALQARRLSHKIHVKFELNKLAQQCRSCFIMLCQFNGPEVRLYIISRKNPGANYDPDFTRRCIPLFRTRYRFVVGMYRFIRGLMA